MLARATILLLALAATTLGQGSRQRGQQLRRYHRLLDEAAQIYWDAGSGRPEGERIDLAYSRLAEAAQLLPDRWEAFFERGLNRCKAIIWARGRAQEEVAKNRARGWTDVQLAEMKRVEEEWIQGRLAEAYQNFRAMESRMRKLREPHPNHIQFANAAMKFANREYLEAKGGQPGAIADFKALGQRKFLPDLCAEHIAWCYLDLGYLAFQEDDYALAQQHWDEALKWTRQPRMRQILFTNKAGAFETDNEYEPAERLLRQQIEEEPWRPSHHKNMGLVLGYQNRLKEALHHYRRARELCLKAKSPVPLALLHGNAWLRAAVIHGKLLEHDGDMFAAWQLFSAYRQMFGDDYNFCLWFGDFAASLDQYDLARIFFERALNLQPHCPQPYQYLVQIAPRTAGPREEIQKRIEETKAAYEAAVARYNSYEEDVAVKRICGGLRDLGDLGGSTTERAGLLQPDPLAEFAPDRPPPWVTEAARLRDPFVPFTPGSDTAAGPTVEGGPAVPEAGGRSLAWIGIGVAAVVLLGAVMLLFRRRARPA